MAKYEVWTLFITDCVIPFPLFDNIMISCHSFYFQNKKRSNLKDKRIRHVNLNLYGVKIMVFPVWIDIEQNSSFYSLARVFVCNLIFKYIANGTILKILQLRPQNNKTSYHYKNITAFFLLEYLPLASVA